jgi:chaperonin GroEL
VIYQKSQTKDIISDKEQLVDIVSETLDTMATIVGATLGPGGRPVLIEREGLAPLITKDGVTVAKSLGIGNSAKNIVVDSAKEICINTAAEAGDGTTTAIVLANAMVKLGQQFLQNNPKHNPQRLVSELHKAYDTVIVPYLKNVSRSVDDESLLYDVATISANGDKEIADAAVGAVLAAGDDGHVQIVEGKDRSTKVDTVDGYVMTTGLKELGQIGPVFINDKSSQKVLMDHGHVFLYNGRMNDLAVPGKLQEVVTDEGGYSDGKPIIVIANDFADSVLDKFAKTTKGGLTIVPIKTPRSGLPNGASMMLDDLSAYTGAEVYDPGTIDQISDIGIGEFTKASINMYETMIVSESDPGDIENRIVELKSIEEAAFSEYDKAHIRANIAKLTGGIGTIIVGGCFDFEIREKKDRTEDAVEAVRSAISEGIVSGGCSTHLIMASMLENHENSIDSWKLLAKALRAPFTRLLENCGEDEQLVLVKLTNEYGTNTDLPKTVFDAKSHQFVDPFKSGIIEPSKVVRVSVGNALSVAALLITLGGIVVVPSNPEMEAQLALGRQAFDQMMSATQE